MWAAAMRWWWTAAKRRRVVREPVRAAPGGRVGESVITVGVVPMMRVVSVMWPPVVREFARAMRLSRLSVLWMLRMLGVSPPRSLSMVRPFGHILIAADVVVEGHGNIAHFLDNFLHEALYTVALAVTTSRQPPILFSKAMLLLRNHILKLCLLLKQELQLSKLEAKRNIELVVFG